MATEKEKEMRQDPTVLSGIIHSIVLRNYALVPKIHSTPALLDNKPSRHEVLVYTTNCQITTSIVETIDNQVAPTESQQKIIYNIKSN